MSVGQGDDLARPFGAQRDLVNYRNLRTQSLARSATSQRRSLDRLTFLSITLSLSLAFLLVLDFGSIIELTAERLTVIGIIVALAIGPFAGKIKIAGMEFERTHAKTDEKDVNE